MFNSLLNLAHRSILIYTEKKKIYVQVLLFLLLLLPRLRVHIAGVLWVVRSHPSIGPYSVRTKIARFSFSLYAIYLYNLSWVFTKQLGKKNRTVYDQLYTFRVEVLIPAFGSVCGICIFPHVQVFFHAGHYGATPTLLLNSCHCVLLSIWQEPEVKLQVSCCWHTAVDISQAPLGSLSWRSFIPGLSAKSEMVQNWLLI